MEPAFGDLVAILTLSGGYNTNVVLAGVASLGAAAGLVGTFAVLRRRALVSDALSHATLPGVCLAFLAGAALFGSGRSLPLLLAGAALSGLLGILAIQAIVRHSRLKEDAAIGAVLSVFFGVGTVLLTYIQGLGTGDQGGLAHFIYGQTAAMRVEDAALIGAVGAGVALVVALLFKEFRLIAFDPLFAAAKGFPVHALDLALLALLVIVTVVGLQAVGIILVVALMIIPPVAARFWTDDLGRMAALAALFGAVSGYVGAAISALVPDAPAGGVIVLVAGVIFVASLLAAPRRGILPTLLRRSRILGRMEAAR